MNPRLMLAAVCFIFGVMLLGGAYAKGAADNEARHTAVAIKKEQADAKAAADLAAAEQTNRLLAQALEDAAYAEPPSATCGLPRSRVLRLRER